MESNVLEKMSRIESSSMVLVLIVEQQNPLNWLFHNHLKSNAPAVGHNVKLEKFSVLAHVLASLTHSVPETLLAQQRLHSIIHSRVLDVNASAETISTLSTITVLVETA